MTVFSRRQTARRLAQCLVAAAISVAALGSAVDGRRHVGLERRVHSVLGPVDVAVMGDDRLEVSGANRLPDLGP